jgi:hypothetical protein
LQRMIEERIDLGLKTCAWGVEQETHQMRQGQQAITRKRSGGLARFRGKLS